MFAQLPMFQRVGVSAYRKDLTNIRALCDFLGNPQDRFPCIHIAGTNGKGSVSFMLAAIMQAHGMRTGLYISPHYKDFRERIRINGQYVSRKFVIKFIERIKPAIETIKPSFFELSVAMAFQYFADKKVDIAIIETGMGGRLDSTNIITPLLSVITNISYDHMQFLGDTLPEIAGEKAGIIKPGVPVVIGESHPETQAVFLAKAQSLQSPVYFADKHFAAQVHSADLMHTVFSINKENKPLDPLQVNLHGSYQALNIQTVMQTVEVLKSKGILSLEDVKVREGLAHLKQLTRFIGRWQILSENPLIICDSAHNEGGLRWVFQHLNSLPHQQLLIVTGMVNDKDPALALSLFPTQARYFFAKANIPRGLEADKLREIAASYGLQGKAYRSVRNAFKAAKRQAKPDDIILVVGSVFVVAEVL